MEVFVARQPIFDRYRQLYAYELLFRSGLKNAFQATDSDRASIKVIADSFLRFGIQRMTGGKRAFINFTRDTLVKSYANPSAQGAGGGGDPGLPLRVAKLFFDPFADQRGLVETARGRSIPECLVLSSGQRNTHNVGSLKHRSPRFLEFILEVGHIVALPKHRQFLNRVARR